MSSSPGLISRLATVMSFAGCDLVNEEDEGGATDTLREGWQEWLRCEWRKYRPPR